MENWYCCYLAWASPFLINVALTLDVVFKLEESIMSILL